MTDTPLLPAERDFYRLVIDLAGDGLFCRCCECVDREGMQERLMDAFEAAMEEARAQTEKGRPREGSPDVIAGTEIG